MKKKIQTIGVTIGLFIIGLTGSFIVGFFGGFIMGFAGYTGIITEPQQYPILSKLFLGATSFGYAILVLPYIYRKDLKSTYSKTGELNYAKPDTEDLKLAGVGTIAGILIAAVAFGGIINYLPLELQSSIVSEETSIVATISFAVASILLVAPGEEILFRGVLQNRLEYSFKTPLSIAVSSVLFGLVHLANYNGDPAAIAIAIIALTAVGGVFAYVYSKSGNIITPIIAHGVYNSILAIAGLLL